MTKSEVTPLSKLLDDKPELADATSDLAMWSLDLSAFDDPEEGARILNQIWQSLDAPVVHDPTVGVDQLVYLCKARCTPQDFASILEHLAEQAYRAHGFRPFEIIRTSESANSSGQIRWLIHGPIEGTRPSGEWLASQFPNGLSVSKLYGHGEALYLESCPGILEIQQRPREGYEQACKSWWEFLYQELDKRQLLVDLAAQSPLQRPVQRESSASSTGVPPKMLPDTPPAPGQEGFIWDDVFDWWYRGGRMQPSYQMLKGMAIPLAVQPGTIWNQHSNYKAQFGTQPLPDERSKFIGFEIPQSWRLKGQ